MIKFMQSHQMLVIKESVQCLLLTATHFGSVSIELAKL